MANRFTLVACLAAGILLIGCKTPGASNAAGTKGGAKVAGGAAHAASTVFPFLNGVEWTFGDPKDSYGGGAFTMTSSKVNQAADHMSMTLTIGGGPNTAGEAVLNEYSDRIELVSAKGAGTVMLCKLPLAANLKWSSSDPSDVKRTYQGEVLKEEDSCTLLGQVKNCYFIQVTEYDDLPLAPNYHGTTKVPPTIEGGPTVENVSKYVIAPGVGFVTYFGTAVTSFKNPQSPAGFPACTMVTPSPSPCFYAGHPCSPTASPSATSSPCPTASGIEDGAPIAGSMWGDYNGVLVPTAVLDAAKSEADITANITKIMEADATKPGDAAALARMNAFTCRFPQAVLVWRGKPHTTVSPSPSPKPAASLSTSTTKAAP